MQNEADSRAQSEFNMALNYLSRLNQLFYICDEAAMSLDIYQWYHSLLALFRELSTEMKDTEITEMKTKSKLLASGVNEFLQIQNTQGVAEVSTELYDGLHEFELTIRNVLKTSGLQMKMKQDARKALKG